MTTAPTGVLYVATEHARFLTEARDSADSLRRCMPDIHVTLFTDRADAVAPRGEPFDDVVTLPRVGATGTSWGWGLLNKIRACVQSPYERSLYLDTDTRVLAPRIRELFGLLKTHDIALAACETGESRCQKLYGRPMFNAGIVAFRRSQGVQALLEAWQTLHGIHLQALASNRTQRFDYVRHLSPSSRHYQLLNDQTALAQYLAPDVNAFQLSCLTLPRIWNWRRNEIEAAHLGEVVIHHCDRFKAADPVEATLPRSYTAS